MYLIPCSHRCAHQIEGYCTLQSLSKATSSDGRDCIYFQEPSPKQAPQLPNRVNPGQLQAGIVDLIDPLDVLSGQDQTPKA